MAHFKNRTVLGSAWTYRPVQASIERRIAYRPLSRNTQFAEDRFELNEETRAARLERMTAEQRTTLPPGRFVVHDIPP